MFGTSKSKHIRPPALLLRINVVITPATFGRSSCGPRWKTSLQPWKCEPAIWLVNVNCQACSTRAECKNHSAYFGKNVFHSAPNYLGSVTPLFTNLRCHPNTLSHCKRRKNNRFKAHVWCKWGSLIVLARKCTAWDTNRWLISFFAAALSQQSMGTALVFHCRAGWSALNSWKSHFLNLSNHCRDLNRNPHHIITTWLKLDHRKVTTFQPWSTCESVCGREMFSPKLCPQPRHYIAGRTHAKRRASFVQASAGKSKRRMWRGFAVEVCI